VNVNLRQNPKREWNDVRDKGAWALKLVLKQGIVLSARRNVSRNRTRGTLGGRVDDQCTVICGAKKTMFVARS